MDLVAEHIRNLAPLKLDGLFIGWTQGAYPSPNYELARQMSRSPHSNMDTVLDALARERFGPEGSPHARKGWTLLSEAFRQYPFDISVVYKAPVSIGPANPVYPSKTGYRATMWGIPYDDLESWRGPYPPEVFATQFMKMADGWQPGIVELQSAVQKAPPNRRQEVQADRDGQDHARPCVCPPHPDLEAEQAQTQAGPERDRIARRRSARPQDAAIRALSAGRAACLVCCPG